MPIFDQGYQHWNGKLSGHAWRWWAITKQGLRGQLRGLGVRIVLVMAWMPTVGLVLVLTLWGLIEQGSQEVMDVVKPMLPQGVVADPQAYRAAVWTIAYAVFFKCEIFFIMLLMVIVGPNLISRDLRFNALPLYLSRPLRRVDYFLGKLGVVGALVAMVAVVPAMAAYVLGRYANRIAGACFSLDLQTIRDTWRLVPASLGYGLVIVVATGLLMLAISSLSQRSLYVGIAWGGFWVISTAVAGVLGMIQYEAINRQATRDYKNVRQEQVQAEAARIDWRPLCSYTANLKRVGEAMLGVDAAWVQIGVAIEKQRVALTPLLGGKGRKPSPINERRFADRMVFQYPWTWSAWVLAGLVGFSLCTLSTRVRSLDRLR